jgi:hypothetical protein
MTRTSFVYVISVGDEEHSCRIVGDFIRGYAQTLEEPGQSDLFEVERVEVPIAIREFGKPTGNHDYRDIVGLLSDEQIAEIRRLGLAEYGDRKSAAEERRWEERREDAVMGRANR